MHLRKARNIFILVVTLSTCPAFAGLSTWTSTGPAGGHITTMAADPDNPATLYVGTNGAGIWKSEDNARTWRVVNQGLPELVIASLVNGPDSATFFAATANGKLARTQDGGANWSEVGNGLTDDSTLVFDHDLGVLYVVSPGRLVRSDDLGNSWQSIPQSHQFFSISVSRGRLFATASSVLYVSDDRGVTWATVPLDIPLTPWGVVTGQDGSIVVFGAARHLARSIDSGKHWIELAPIPASFRTFTLYPYAGGIIASVPEGVLQYDNNAKAWTSTGPGLNGVFFPNIVRTSAEGGSIFVFGYADRTLYRWTTTESDWKVVNVELRAAPTRDVSVAGDNVYAATYEGVARLANASESWESINIAPGLRTAAYSIEASVSGDILVGAINGFHKSVDSGATWSSVTPGYGFIAELAAAPSDRRKIYAAAAEGMIKSVDGGATWFRTGEVPYDYLSSRHNYYDIGWFYAFDASDLKVDPSDPETVYVCAELVYKSIDGGAKWNAISHLPMSQIAIDWSASPPVLYGAAAGTSYFSGVWKSADGGATWQELGLSEHVSAIAIDPVATFVLYAGTPAGKVFRSADGGANWQEMAAGLNGASINRIVVDPSTHRIYAATDGGVLEYHDLPDGAVTYAVRFRTYYGNFVSAGGCGGGRVNANATQAGPCETFTIVDRDGGVLLDGDRVNLKAPNGQFLVAENGGASECRGCSSPVNANRSGAGAWELFTLHKIDGSNSRISVGDQISFRSIAGDYVSAEWGGANGCACDAVLIANRSAAREWETFTLTFP